MEESPKYLLAKVAAAALTKVGAQEKGAGKVEITALDRPLLAPPLLHQPPYTPCISPIPCNHCKWFACMPCPAKNADAGCSTKYAHASVTPAPASAVGKTLSCALIGLVMLVL